MSLLEEQYKQCYKIYNDLGKEALHMTHYQLADSTEIKDALLWREFLLDPRTAEYISEEMSIIRGAAINEMVQKAPNSNSVGQSQLMNALQKLEETSAHKEGPIFIYTYVPLNDAQKKAPNIRELSNNPLKANADGTYTFYEKEE